MRFGTDGVRGRAYSELTVDAVRHLGHAAADVFAAERVVVGRDTRASGPDLLDALAEGLAAGGTGVLDLGVAPTPAVAHVAAAEGIPGAVISASHNPWYDNGIKFFAPGGRKLDDAQQTAMEAAVAANGGVDRAEPRVESGADRLGRYLDALVASLDGRRLDGLYVVVDAANGAAAGVAGELFGRTGATVELIGAAPDGENINRGCGSTDLAALAAAVRSRGADAGLALDGDADRVLAVDASGSLVDGDQIIAMCAVDLHERGQLRDGTVVVTVMTNLGFRLAMARHGIRVEETPVGDRHVLAALDGNGWSLGGEQSGHVIFADRSTTGDGMLTGLQVLDLMVRRGASLAELATVMERLPQVLRNVPVSGDPQARVAALAGAVAAVETRLGERGRVLVRPSGTEPLIRVMAEAASHDDAAWAVDVLIDALIAADQMQES
jgi:phosphoglucosamine mutase